jgi:flagellar hook protein FlgE
MPLTSFYTALTGLNNNSLAINIIGDNLANMNTVAFKSSKANFGELLAGLQGTSDNGNPITFGLGSTLNGITHMNTQGTISHTGKSTDVAINGNGFLVVETEGGMGYTRSGKFEFDSTGGLMTSDGFRLLGYMGVNGEVNNNGQLVPIEIQKGQLMPARASTNLSIVANLNSEAEIGSGHSTPLSIVDSLGAMHDLEIEYTKTGEGAWDWEALIPAVDFGGTETDPPVSVGNGSLTFDSDGRLMSPATNPTLNISGLSSGASDMTVDFILWSDNNRGCITQVATASSNIESGQNGIAASFLQSISINSDGMIVGKTENGQSIELAQLAMADFPNVDGLQKYKGSTFTTFPSSGDPSIGVAGAGGRGTIVGSSVEQSNVDMAQEFVNLIVAQRAYQANSRIITTTDELYQESINLKR